jgi:hypothetical protein
LAVNPEDLHVTDIVVGTLVSLINLGAARQDDPAQLKLAIDSAEALLPLVEQELGPDLPAVRNAISQLQLAYAKGARGGGEPAPETPESPPAPMSADEPQKGPAQASGRLWVPGQ